MSSLKAEGFAVADLARHSTYLQEYMWEVLTAGQADARCITVMDLGGMSLRRLSSPDTAELIKATSAVLDAHYPGRVATILVVNAPGWVASAWSLIANLMPQTLRERVMVTRDLRELHDFIDPAQLPLQYGGTDATPPGQGPEEALLEKIVLGVRAGRRPPRCSPSATAAAPPRRPPRPSAPTSATAHR